MTQRITLLFGGKLSSGGVIPQLDAAQKLLGILDECPTEIFGLKIGLGDGFGIDPGGTIWLHAQSDSASWIQYLNNDADLDYCHQRKKEEAKLSEKERTAAKLLGVGMIFAHGDVAMGSSTEYDALLERVMQETAEWPNISGSGSYRPLENVNIMVVPAPQQEQQSEKEQKITSDESGKILIPVTASGPEILAAIRRLGPEASRSAALAAREESELSSLRTQVERKLRLRKVARHPDLPAHKFKTACLRMLQNSITLGPLLDGLPIRIAESNAVHPGQPHIDISWSFTL